MVSKNYCHDVSAVLVTYNPNIECLCASIQSVAGQVSDIYIVDNGSANFSQDWLILLEVTTASRLYLLPQSSNLGIGAAQNVGIRQARECSSSFVLLLDQDSQVEPDMVVRLRSTYTELIKKNIFVAALGPQFKDSENGRLSQFVTIGVLGFTLVDCNSENTVVDADFIVASGSLIPMTALDSVGLMDEGLFIDLVDTEWCLRAKSKGFHIVGVGDAIMTHTLGEQRKEVWFLRQRSLPFHRPFRYYYMIRNRLLLYRRNYISCKWKWADAVKWFKILIFFCLAAPNRLACLKMMLLGMLDGFKGVSGKRNE